MTGNDVFLYALSTCPWCRKTKAFFEEHDVPFGYVDVDTLPEHAAHEAAQRAYLLSGARAFPVVRIGDQVVVGYDPERFAALLGIGRAA
jgi:glutaredoxin